MNIVIDFSAINEFVNQPAGVMFWQFFKTIGWMPIAIIFIVGAFMMWMDYVRGKFMSKQKFIF